MNTQKLVVFLNSLKVGVLERHPHGALTFTYAQSWLEQKQALSISRQLPLQEEPYTGQKVRDYFSNLLPDDLRIREAIAARTQASSAEVFDLLRAIGRDCVGALQFYPEDLEPGSVSKTKGRVISNTAIANLIQGLYKNPLGITPERDFRISLAGVQKKTALLFNEGQWFLPLGATPTTHILKPSIGPLPGGPDLSLSVENEWLCLSLLRAFGLETAEAEILHFGKSRVLTITRFDRVWSGRKIFRLPQEDLCQALGFGPDKKYESDGGPGIKAILSLLNESDRRDVDRRYFMKAQLVFWLLAAIDGHAKNFSIFQRPRGGLILTPLYDVLSADPHINPRSFPAQKIKLAMSVGENRHTKIRDILPRHWLQTAAQCKFAAMEALMTEVSATAAQAIEAVSKLLPKSFPKVVSESIFNSVTRRARILARG